MKFTLAIGLVLAAGAWLPAAPAGAAESRLAAPATLPAGEAAAVRLRRALQELAGRDSAAALRELEAVDLASWGLPGAPSELDRVAFVRGWLYRRRGDDAAFAALLRGHSIDASSPSPLRRWLAGQESWTALAAASDPAEALAHAQALAVDSADQGILLYLRGLVAEAAGEPAER